MRHTIILFTVTILALVGITHAQPDSLWSQTFGGEDWDCCKSLIQTADGGYALAGCTESYGAGEKDMWLVKTDEEGDLLWSRTFGGENDDYCHSIIQTEDGGFTLAGSTTSFGAGGYDMWLVRTNADGDSLWSRTFGREGMDICKSIIQIPEGGYALGGHTHSFITGGLEMWLVITDVNGDSIWSRTFGGEPRERCYSLIQTADGGYALAGHTYSFGAMWLVKTNAEGDSLWSRAFRGKRFGLCNSVIQTVDGGYALAGLTEVFHVHNYDANMWFVKTDEDGDSLWSRTFGGWGNDECMSIMQTVDGGYVLAGYTWFFGDRNTDLWLVRTDADGDSLWSISFGGESGDFGSSIIQTADRGYALAGYTGSFGAGGYDMWLIKTGPDPVSAPPESFIPLLPSSFILLPAYPNPFNSTTTIRYGLPFPSHVSLQVYDISGRQITTLYEGNKQAGIYTTNLIANVLPSGLYFVQLEASGELFTQKVILVK